jgi:hypothetical protein
MTACGGKKINLLLGFNALRQDPQLQIVCDLDDSVHDDLVLFSHAALPEEFLVQF